MICVIIIPGFHRGVSLPYILNEEVTCEVTSFLFIINERRHFSEFSLKCLQWFSDLCHSLFVIRIIGFQNKRSYDAKLGKDVNLRIFAARFVRFPASTTLVFYVLSHLESKKRGWKIQPLKVSVKLKKSYCKTFLH